MIGGFSRWAGVGPRRAAALLTATLVALGVAARPQPAGAELLGYAAYAGQVTNQDWDQSETAMLPTEVGDAFAQQYSVTLAGGAADQVYAQPLVAADGAGHTDLIVATEANAVEALDPDDQTAAPRWSLGPAQLGTPFAMSELPGCNDITPSSGITATPVVDPGTHTLYVSSNRYVSGGSGPSEWLLHGIDLATGQERTGFPVTYAGAADNAPGVSFDPVHQLQRPGLVLLGGVVYAAFGSHCDTTPYQGWVIGVSAYDGSTTPAITARWTDEATPTSSSGGEAGIWMAGASLSSDGPGQLILTTGNGDLPSDSNAAVPGTSPPGNLGESVVRLGVQPGGSLAATDFFSPQNGASLNSLDADIGSSAPVLVPGSFFGVSSPAETAVVTGKGGTMYLLDADSRQLGGYLEGHPGFAGDAALDEVGIDHSWSHVGVWGGDGGFVYLVPGGGNHGLDAFRAGLNGGTPTLTLAGAAPPGDGSFGFGSSAPVISSDGSGSLTAVVWAVQRTGTTSANLVAYDPVPDANKVLHRLYSASLGNGVPSSKFALPVTDHGHVYVATNDGHVLGFWGSPPLSEQPVLFTPQVVGTTGQATASLTASTPLTVTAVSSGDPTDFGVGSPTPGLPAALGAGQTLSVPLTFSPGAATTDRATVSVAVTMPDSSTRTLHVGVAGTGLPSPGHLSVDAASVSFGAQPVGTTASSTIHVSNDGGTPLSLTATHQPAAPFSAAGLPTTLPAHSAPVAVTVGYHPTQAVASADSLGLSWSSSSGSETAGGTPSVGLSGSGVVVATPPPQTPPPSPAAGVSNPTPSPSPPPPPPPAAPAAQAAPAPAAAGGYWLVGSDGGIFPFGPSAAGYGSTGGTHLNAPIVTAAAAPGGSGYWLVGADGGVFPFGPGAAGLGSTGGIHLNAPVVAMAPTPDGHGYWLVAADGGVFPFGDAAGYGSTGGIHLNAPIVAIASTPDGRGYWLVAADGGIFPFGDAGGFGSTGGIRLNAPIVGMAATPDAGGYWLAAADGGIFPFGDAHGYGSTGGVRLSRPVVGLAATPDGAGYLLVGADGGVFPFGDAAGYGSTGALRLNRPIIGIVEAV